MVFFKKKTPWIFTEQLNKTTNFLEQVTQSPLHTFKFHYVPDIMSRNYRPLNLVAIALYRRRQRWLHNEFRYAEQRHILGCPRRSCCYCWWLNGDVELTGLGRTLSPLAVFVFNVEVGGMFIGQQPWLLMSRPELMKMKFRAGLCANVSRLMPVCCAHAQTGLSAVTTVETKFAH